LAASDTTLTTLYVNNPPTTTADNASITEDTRQIQSPATFASNDSDPDGNTPSVTNAGTFILPHGTLVLHADGSYSYVLNNSNPDVNALKRRRISHGFVHL